MRAETETVEKAIMSLLDMPEGSKAIDLLKDDKKYKIYLYVMGLHHAYENIIRGKSGFRD